MQGDKLFMIKIGTMYVKFASKFSQNIDLTAEMNRAKKISEEEKDFVLLHFPDAEVRTFDVVESLKGW